jgi:hypothetical protein
MILKQTYNNLLAEYKQLMERGDKLSLLLRNIGNYQ